MTYAVRRPDQADAKRLEFRTETKEEAVRADRRARGQEEDDPAFGRDDLFDDVSVEVANDADTGTRGHLVTGRDCCLPPALGLRAEPDELAYVLYRSWRRIGLAGEHLEVT